MPDTLKERKALADRELVTKFIGETKSYESAVGLGFISGMLTDPMSRRVADMVSKHYRLEGVVPSVEYLKDHGVPFHAVVSADPVEQVLPRVRNMAVQLRVIRMAESAERLVLRSPEEAAEQLSEEIRGIGELAKLRKPIPTQADLTAASLAQYEIRKTNSLGDAIPLVWGPISDMVRGKAKGDPHFFYGLPKSYKSTLMFWDAYWTAKQGYRVYVGTGEWNPQRITDLMLCYHAEVGLKRFRSGALFPEEEMRLAAARETYPALPLLVGPKTFPGVRELDLMASRAREFGAECVYLDGAHKLPVSLGHEDVGALAQRITEHAGRMDVPWVVAVQANRYGGKKSRKKDDDEKETDSSSDDIGGSVAWTQECALAIRCVKQEYGRVLLKVVDSRWGDTGGYEVMCQPGEAMHIVGGLVK